MSCLWAILLGQSFARVGMNQISCVSTRRVGFVINNLELICNNKIFWVHIGISSLKILLMGDGWKVKRRQLRTCVKFGLEIWRILVVNLAGRILCQVSFIVRNFLGLWKLKFTNKRKRKKQTNKWKQKFKRKKIIK